ncbi:MAG: ABC transporter substrate-binding protein [Candidatus Izemoplasmatales bacterium]|nr:ABC transporter substrate-binding protein [Candidatus Izemoplasmatales bacterium]
MKKVYIILVVLMVSMISLGCEKEENILKVLTSSGYEPYEMMDKSGNLIGFDIELMEKVAEEIGVEIEWKDVDFSGIIASLQANTADAAIAGISPSPERQDMVDFSRVYFNNFTGLANYIIFDSKNNFNSLEDLKGLIVGAQMGTVQADFLSKVKDEYGFEVDLRNTNAQIVEEIKTGRIDALIVESPIAITILEANETLVSSGFESYLDDYQGLAIAFPKGSIWAEKVNQALIKLEENGFIHSLEEKWIKE